MKPTEDRAAIRDLRVLARSVFSGDRSTVLAERKEAIGIATNNVAEYRGLIAGLEAAAR